MLAVANSECARRQLWMLLVVDTAHFDAANRGYRQLWILLICSPSSNAADLEPLDFHHSIERYLENETRDFNGSIGISKYHFMMARITSD